MMGEIEETQLSAQINIVPLLDVLLVLLVMVMIAASSTSIGNFTLDMPQGSITQISLDALHDQTLEITKEGHFYFRNTHIASEDLEKTLSQAFPNREVRTNLLLKADRHTSFDHVAQPMVIAKKLNLKLAILTHRK